MHSTNLVHPKISFVNLGWLSSPLEDHCPNLCRELIKASISNALQKCTKEIRKILIDLTIFCLENILVQNGNSFYTQSKGIITGDNNSVSIANIALHHVIMPIATTIKTTKFFKRCIDDILFLSETLEVTNNVKSQLKCAFENTI